LHQVWEVQVREFAEEFHCFNIVCYRRLYLIVEAAYSWFFPIDAYLCHEFSYKLFQVNTFILGRPALPRPLIMNVLGPRTKPQIAPSIVQAVIVSVVNEKTFRGAGNQPVHFECFSVFLTFCIAYFFALKK